MKDKTYTTENMDRLSEMENQLKDLWSQYIRCLENRSFSNRAQDLKKKYFEIYQDYRRYKNWNEAIKDKEPYSFANILTD